MQIRFRSILGHSKQFGDFTHSAAEPIIKTQHRLIDLRKRSNTLGKGLIALRRFGLPVRPEFRSCDVVQNRLVRVRISEANPRFQVHCLVECDPVDPRAEFRLAAKRRKCVMNLEKYFLRHVFRFRNEFSPQDRYCKTKYLRAMPANQFRERLLIPASHAVYELRIGFDQGLASSRTLEEMEGDQTHAQKTKRQRCYPKAVRLRVKSNEQNNHRSH